MTAYGEPSWGAWIPNKGSKRRKPARYTERNRAVSPTTQAGGRTRDLRDGGSTCHGSHQQEKGTPLCLQPPPSLALALFCAAQFLPVAVVFPACLSPPSPPLSSLSATRVPTSPSAPATLVYKAGALKTAAARARNCAGHSGKNPSTLPTWE